MYLHTVPGTTSGLIPVCWDQLRGRHYIDAQTGFLFLQEKPVFTENGNGNGDIYALSSLDIRQWPVVSVRFGPCNQRMGVGTQRDCRMLFY